LINFKIRSSLYFTGAIALILIIFVGVYGLFKLSDSQQRLENNTHNSIALIEAVDKARNAQVEFKIQVQEWKNILIRGHEKESFDKYNESFKKSSDNVQTELIALKKIAENLKINTTNIVHLQTHHLELLTQYQNALKSFDPDDTKSSRNIDHLVKGIDREPTEDMDNIVKDIKDHSDKMFNSMSAASQSEYKSVRIFFVIIIIIVVIILSATLWYVSSRIINSLSNAVNTLTSASTQIASTIDEHERIASQQSAAVNQTSTTTNELGSSSRLSSEQAESTGADTRLAITEAEKGNAIVSEMLLGMEEIKYKVTAISEHILGLNKQTDQISGIAKLVSNFANETKMLAVNASIEAVRAGSQGKGFSLLAVEIRKLAQESKVSAESITALVNSIIKSSEETVTVTQQGMTTVEQEMKLAHQTSEAFKNISASINNAFESTKQITLNVKQQSAAISQIVEAMNSLNIGAKETASGITQTKTGITSLNEISNELKDMI
jgi:methyl-accepting chemotaxis protein